MRFVVGIPSFNRPWILKLVVSRLALYSREIDSLVIVADTTKHRYVDEYKEIVMNAKDVFNDVIYDIRLGRRGSVGNRNLIYELVSQHFTNNYVLIDYEDDFICPLTDWIYPIRKWLINEKIGAVGGRVINLRRRRIDPDFHLNLIPYMADILTGVTGFIFIDTKHGPRYVEYTSQPMAIRVNIIKKGLRYDAEYKGTGYREESDLQEQIRRMGYKIVFEPKFYVYHLNPEIGGNRTVQDATERFYWKARNHTYFMLKHGKPLHKLMVSNIIIMMYALRYGVRAFIAASQGLRAALVSYRGNAKPVRR